MEKVDEMAREGDLPWMPLEEAPSFCDSVLRIPVAFHLGVTSFAT